MVTVIYKIESEIWGLSPQKNLAAQKHQNFGDFVLLEMEADKELLYATHCIQKMGHVYYVFVSKALVGLVIVAPTIAVIELGFGRVF